MPSAAVESEAGMSTRLTKTVSGLVPVTAATQALGFASSVVLARYLGATADTDAYYLALILPGISSGIIIAALRQGAIPALTGESVPSKEQDFPRLVSALVTGVSVIALTLAIVIGLIGVAIAELTLTGMDTQSVDRVSIYSLLLIPYTAGAAAQGAMTAALAVKGSFRIAVAVYGFESAAKILFVVALAEWGGYALVAGNLVGQGLSIAALWAALNRKGVRVRLTNPRGHPVLKAALFITAPLIVSQSVLQVNPFVDRGVAASIEHGAVTAMELATRLAVIPQVLIAGSLVTPLVATWSIQRTRVGWRPVESSYVKVMKASWLASALIVVATLPASHALVDVLYGNGRFTPSDVNLTAGAFAMLLLGLPATMSMVACSSLFVVRGETVFPMKVGISNVTLNLILTVSLAQVMGLRGVALGTSVTMFVNLATYMVGIAMRWEAIPIRSLGISFAQIGASCLIGIAVAWGIYNQLLPDTAESELIRSLLASAAGCLAFTVSILIADSALRRSIRTRLSNA